MILREGWGVKNISAILLFRKFCFSQVGDMKFSVCGPQIIGRGPRRISQDPDAWDQCHVIDHPISRHDWLWEMIEAYKYPESLNPGDVIDEAKIPEPKSQLELEVAETRLGDESREFDSASLPPVPEPEVVEPITDWRTYLDHCQYDLKGMIISQKITQGVPCPREKLHMWD